MLSANLMAKACAGLSPSKQSLLLRKLQQRTTLNSVDHAIVRRTDRSTAPLSYVQQQMWFLDQLHPGNIMYNRPSAMRISGPLYQKLLQISLKKIISRHEILRTTFSSLDGIPFQVIHAPADVLITFIDISAEPEYMCEHRAREMMLSEARRTFDLASGPLFRAFLLKLARDQHIILFCTHHIVFDGWSERIFWQELAVHYEALSTVTPPVMPELAVQYGDYAYWQQKRLQGPAKEALLQYWRRQLKGLEILNLPVDRPRPAVLTHAGAREDVILPRELGLGLKELSRICEATLFMTLLAAFQALLGRYCGQDDVAVGTPVAGRQRLEIEPLIGVFINNLVLRAHIGTGRSFRELLAQVRATTLDGFAHQEMPFELLIEELRQARDRGRSLLIQVLFQLRNLPDCPVEWTGLRVEKVQLDLHTSKLELALDVSELADGLHCQFEYNTDWFSAGTIRALAENYERLLRDVVAEPDLPLDQLGSWRQIAPPSAPVRAQSLSELATKGTRPPATPSLGEPQPTARLEQGRTMNTTGSPLSKDLLHAFFFEQALQRPDQTAVITPKRTLSYKELQNLANQAAHWLRQRGAHPNSLVAVVMEKGWEQVVGVLGVLASGAAYLPIDATLPEERLTYILEHGQVSLVLTQSWHDQKIEWSEGIQRFCVDHADQSGLNESSLEPVQKPGDLAYVIYTSGSTGLPKGVVIDHRGAVNTMIDINRRFRVKPEDRVLAMSALNFDLSVYDVFGLLAAGGTIVMPDAFSERDPAHWAELVVKHGVTIWDSVPALMQMLVEYLAGRSERLPDSLRMVMMSGDWIPVDLPDRIKNMAKDVKVVGLGGATEASIWSILYPIEKVEPSWTSIPYGRPMANQSVQVLNEALVPCPVCVPGQLYIGGIGLAKGYWRDEEKTQKSFITHPQTGERLYRTGDMGRNLPDGNIEFLGREDFQVKIGGHRIELGEIETALLKHPRVKTSVVTAAGDARGIKRLVAYVVPIQEPVSAPPSSAHGAIADALMEFLRGKLPEYMVPARFVLMDALPLSGNGKVDRKALPALKMGTAFCKEYVAPRTDIECTIVEIWKEVLKLEQIGVHVNFFELGGHSLLAIRMISRVRAAFGVELPLRLLFEQPTVAALAAHISKSATDTHAPPLLSVTRMPHVPMSFAQQRLWFLDRFQPGLSLYNLPLAVHLDGFLDIGALEQAFNEIVKRHESLHTTFQLVDGVPMQVIASAQNTVLSVVDLSEMAEGDRTMAISRLVQEERQQPFDLSQGPLLRVKLLRKASEQHVLLFTMHHIVSDGWSMEVLFRELDHLYAASLLGKQPSLPELPVQYADYAVWQHAWLKGEVLEKQLHYWKERLRGAPPVLELPADRPRPVARSFRGSHHSVVLTTHLLKGLKELSQESGVTLFMTLLAAFQLLLHRYSGRDDIVVGSPISGRNHSEIENLIGFFVNTLVLRTDFTGNPTFRELLGRVREVALGAYEHQDLPFEKLVEELNPERQVSYNPLVQVVFSLQNTYEESFKLPQLMILPESVNNNSAKLDLFLFMNDNGNGLDATLEYSTDLFDRTTIERIVGHFQTLLEGIVSSPEQRVSELPLLKESEQHQLLVMWNNTGTDYPKDLCIHQAFEIQAQQTPEAVALLFDGDTLSYRELECRANQLASHLRVRGVGPDVLVGICMDRCLEMIVAMLGILKAGGAYVPLDPSYPSQRLDWMIGDTGMKVLLTHSGLSAKFSSEKLELICLDSCHMPEPDAAPRSSVTPDNLAYVIYTSGSTGIPKGVAVPHRGVLRLLFGVDYVRLDAHQTLLHLSSISFDASMFEVWGALLHGARCVLFPEKVLTIRQLDEALRNNGVTTLWLTAAYYNTVIDEAPQILRRVKQLIIGGEALSVTHVRRGLKLLPDTQIVNGYGPTESTTFTCCYRIPRKLADDARSIPIGRPIGNTLVYILDLHLKPVPVGVAGEFFIGGDGLARGYLNRPELSAEKFISHSFCNASKMRLYRTGDLARYLPDGNIDFIGRIDNQVKLHGFRIELGEIESVLKMHPAVYDAVVLMREDQPGNKRIVAYVVFKSARNADNQEFRNFIQSKLPEYMVPSAFVVIDSLPLTANGKMDRNALPVPDPILTVAKQSFLAPRDFLEEYLATLWGGLLGTISVSVRDNFFDLGGHSLLAVRVVSQIKKNIDKEITVSDLFMHPTVEQLAEIIRSEGWLSPFSLLIPYQPFGSKPPFFCIHGAADEAAKLIGLEQPFYGGMPHGYFEDTIPATTEEMASDYVREIRTIQPEGPYYIGGYSFGGMLAFEIAHQIKKQGQQVALLVLIDATPAEKQMKVSNNALINELNTLLPCRIKAYIIRVVKQFEGLRPKEMISYVLKGIWGRTVVRTGIESKAKEYICRGCIAAGIKLPKKLKKFYRGYFFMNAAQMYSLKKYDGKAVLFRAVTGEVNIQAFWQKQVENSLEVYDMPGDHFELLKYPQVEVFAKNLKMCLERAQDQAQG